MPWFSKPFNESMVQVIALQYSPSQILSVRHAGAPCPFPCTIVPQRSPHLSYVHFLTLRQFHTLNRAPRRASCAILHYVEFSTKKSSCRQCDSEDLFGTADEDVKGDESEGYLRRSKFGSLFWTVLLKYEYKSGIWVFSIVQNYRRRL